MKKLLIILLCLTSFSTGKADNTERAFDAMKRATHFMMDNVSYHGAFVWNYLPDFSRQWGELEAKRTQGWVQAPGTPSMGHLMLDAYHATGDEYYYKCAETIANALMAGQHASGGWNYLFDMAGEKSAVEWYSTIGKQAWRLEEFQHYYGNATFDDGGTIQAGEFFLRLYMEKKASKYKKPLTKVINFVLKSQYANGGWPQRYPLMYNHPFRGQSDYSSFITINDDVMIDCIDFLQKCRDVLDMKELQEPVERAMKLLVKLQQPKPLAGWADQYFAEDLKPAHARSYEPRSVNTGTTVKMINMLINYYRQTGDKEFLQGIPAAIEFLRSQKLPVSDVQKWGREPRNKGDILVPRFIDPDTRKPLYVHRIGSNVGNGHYFTDQNISNTIGHYSSATYVNPDALQSRYEAAKKETITEKYTAKLRHYYFRAPLGRNYNPDLASVEKIISDLNEEGYWQTPIRQVSNPFKPLPENLEESSETAFQSKMVGDEYDTSPYPSETPVLGISTQTFINNMSRLIQLVAKPDLGPHTFLVDGSLTDAEAAKSPYIFKTFNEAAAHLTNGTADEPMIVLIKPWVYWIDDPDDNTVKHGVNGAVPIGLTVKCEHLHLIGVGSSPQDVVLASQRGQSQGAYGNFTMFDFYGDDMVVKNLTMGNFCNVDLEYPLKPELGRKKKSATITQAHVANCHGDRIFAENVRFISRLNMSPLSGAKRILFKDCHMESTDDALCSTGVYLHCDFDFYGQKPFYKTDAHGAVLLDCDFTVKHTHPVQYFCKSQNPLTVIDSRFHVLDEYRSGGELTNFNPGWATKPGEWLRCYQSNVTANGKPVVIGTDKPNNTIDLMGRKALYAYRLSDVHGNVVYNTYNLLRGEDGWDPLNVRYGVENISRRLNVDAADIATNITVSPLKSELQTGGEPVTLSAEMYRHCGYKLNNEPLKWKVLDDGERYVRLEVSEDGRSVKVIPITDEDEAQTVVVVAYTESGLEGAAELLVKPAYLPAPALLSAPKIVQKDGWATLEYKLDLKGRDDESLVSWYRCKDKNGTRDIPLYVSNYGEPTRSVYLSTSDNGWYLKAVIQPKHLRCLPGQAVTTYTAQPIQVEGDPAKRVMALDFSTIPYKNRPELVPGFWSFDGYKPEDTKNYGWTMDMSKDFWYYGEGTGGAYGYGLLQAQRGARMLYCPLPVEYGDMEVDWGVDPAKVAGQGFGSATGQYMDMYIKFDPYTLTGYALRIERTVKYHNAVEFSLLKYENGKITRLTNSVASNCYRTGCIISLKAIGNKLTAHVETSLQLPERTENADILSTVDLEAQIEPNKFGGLGLQHTGSTGEGVTMIHTVKVAWK